MSDELEEIDLFDLDIDKTTGEVIKRELPAEPSVPKEIKISATLLQDYQSCPAKAWGRITRQKQTKGVALVMGIAIHEAIEHYIKYRADLNKVFSDTMKVESEKNEIPLTGKDGVEAFRVGPECLVAAKTILDTPDASGVPFVNKMNPDLVEKFFLIELDGRKFTGKIDFIHMLEDGRYSANDWKGLALDTPLPTLSGWTTMGDIEQGDYLFDRHGKVCHVVAKSDIHRKKCYRVTFEDNTSIVCDYDHKWVTSSGKITPYTEEVLTTEQIRDTLVNPGSGKANHRILNPEPLDLPDAVLPVPPYVLGCWLGDGNSKDGTLSGADRQIFEEIEAEGFEIGPAISAQKETVCVQRTIYKLSRFLSILNLFKNKHVPSPYLRASKSQRLALLQGLMDTDGTYNKVRNQAIFSNTNKNLADAVEELVLSLGSRCKIFKLLKTGFGAKCVCYDVVFTPIGFNPFRLKRKADLVRTETCVKSTRRVIASVEEVTSVPTQCIAVSSKDETYLCGRQMVPTHNSGKTVPNEFELNTNLQFTFYAWASATDPTLPTYGTLPYKMSYLHLRGASVEKDANGKTVPKNRSKLPLKYSFQTTRDQETIDRTFASTINPIVSQIEAGYFPRFEGKNCSWCGFFDKARQRCGVELPYDMQTKRGRDEVAEKVAALPQTISLLDFDPNGKESLTDGTSR